MNDGVHDRGTTWIFIILVLIVFAAAVTYFSRNNPDLKIIPSPDMVTTPARVPRLYTVFYQLNIFSPTNLRIHVGDSVKFLNNSSQPIRVVSDSVKGTPVLIGFDSVGDVQLSGAFTYTFTGAGIFGYHNARNTDETGTVIVRP